MSMSNVVTHRRFFWPVEVIPRSSVGIDFAVTMSMQETGHTMEHWSQPMQSSMFT